MKPYERTPGIREKQRQAMLEVWARRTPKELEELSQTFSKAQTERWINTSTEELVRFSGHCGYAWTEEMKEAAAERMRQRNYQRYKERTSQGLPYLYEGQREAAILGQKILFNNPEDKDRLLKAMAEGRRMHPNRKEQFLLEELEGVAPGEFRYNEGWFILDGKIPDFVNVNGKKLLVEVFGNYWHLPGDDEERITHFREYGYETLVIWEDELYIGNKELRDKLVEFTRGGG